MITGWDWEQHRSHKFHSANLEHAERVARDVSSRSGLNFQPWWCPVCQSFHIGRQKGFEQTVAIAINQMRRAQS